MSADDLNLNFDADSNDNDALELQSNSDPSEVNRPADGARQATPGEVLFEGFGGSEDAGDFLGLDTELHFSNSAPGQGSIDTERSDTEGLGLAEAPGAPPASAPYETEGTEGEAPAYDETVDEEGVYAEADEYDEEAYDEAFEDGESYEEAGPHKGALFVAALAVGALVVVGAVFGPGLLDKFNGGGDVAPTTTSTTASAGGATVVESSVASTGATTDPTSGTEATGPEATTDPAVDTTGSSTTDPNASTGDDAFFASADGQPALPVKTGERGSLERLFSSPTFELVPREVTGIQDPVVVSPTGGRTPDGDPVASTGSETGIGDVAVPSDLAIQFPGVGTDRGAPNSEYFTAGFDWANQGDVDVVWRRNDVPEGALDAPARVATPRVGTVRVHLVDGDFFEGKLVAMGEGFAWIETEPGRMAFPAADIDAIEALGFELAATDPGAVNAPIRGERVRVRAPGGVIYGHVVSRDDQGSVTLRTDGGGKITLTDATIERIGSSRAVIVQD